MRTIDWLKYNDLFGVIRAHGFVAKPLPSGGTRFVHTDGAELSFPFVNQEEPVHRLHYGATQTIMLNYVIMTRDALDLALLQAAHKLPATV